MPPRPSGAGFTTARQPQSSRPGWLSGSGQATEQLGVELFEESPAVRIDDSGSEVKVFTPGGRATAARIVLANGPALAGQGSPLRQNVTLASSHMVITEPVPDVIEELGWDGGEAISDCRALLTYFRTTPDGRLALGWGGGRIVAGSRRFGRAELDRRRDRQA